MPLSPEEVEHRLHDACGPTTLEALVRLAGLSRSTPDIIVPPRFFWCGNDRAWLSRRQLIRQSRYGYVITAHGLAIAEQLRATLAQICP